MRRCADRLKAILFHVTVNAPDHALFALDFQAGTTSVLEADGSRAVITPEDAYYKARFADGWLQWIRRITAEESYREFHSGRW
jgi:hypothetical protein